MKQHCRSGRCGPTCKSWPHSYRRVHVLLHREGHKDNVKRVYRIYREEGLSLRLKRPRRNKAAMLRLTCSGFPSQ
jgi:hypothetical protein